MSVTRVEFELIEELIMSAFGIANEALALAKETAAAVAALPVGGTGVADTGDFDPTALVSQVNALTDKVNALAAEVGAPTDGTTPPAPPVVVPTPGVI